MPYCKSCHKEISRLDNDVCPYCGQIDPIEGKYETKDITSHIDAVKGDYELYKSKSHKIYGFLCMALGFLGIHEFYIGFWKKGIAFIASFALLEGAVGTLLYFLAWPSPFVYLILWGAFIVFDVVLGLLLLKKDCLKDAEGEFLR